MAPPGSILVAIDFENIFGIQATPELNVNAQMGVAILDPPQLNGPSQSDGSDGIQSIQFASGCPNYTRVASNKFVFGNTVACENSDFTTHLTSLLPPGRPFVLVAQSFHFRAALTKLGYDIDNNPQFAGIADTYPMSGDVFHTGRPFGSLKKILKTLGVGWN